MDFEKLTQELRSALIRADSSTEQARILLPPSCLSPDDDHWQTTILNIIFEHPHHVKSMHRVLKKTITVLHNLSAEKLQIKLTQTLKNLFSSNDNSDFNFPFLPISFLIEDCAFSRTLLSSYLVQIIEHANHVIKDLLFKDLVEYTSRNNEHLCDVIKTILQVIQFMKADVTSYFTISSNEAILMQLLEIVNNCVVILQENKKYTSSLCNMCSIFIGHVLNYDLDDYNIATTMCLLLDSSVESFPKPQHPFSSIAVSRSLQSSVDSFTVFRIFLLKGLFSCTRPAAFFKGLNIKACPNFMHFSFNLVCSGIELIGESQYHAFLALKHWWCKVQSYFKSGKGSSLKDIVDENGDFFQNTLKILFKHWDNPISGVPAVVVDIFKILIQINSSVHQRSGTDKTVPTTFVKTILDDLMKMPSSVKGKYNFITVLVSEIGGDFLVRKYPEFLVELIPLLGINHLCPAVSKTYKMVIITSLKRLDKERLTTFWIESLLPGLMYALVNSNPTIRLNALKLWLPIHIKLVPGAYNRLVEAVNKHFCGSNSKMCSGIKLLALVSITKVAKSENVISFSDVDEELMRLSLSSFNDDVRLEAFHLVCFNNRTSEIISTLEMELIKTYLPMNMNMDSPTFRQRLVYCLRLFFERIKDSVLAGKKTLDKQGSDQYINMCEEMLTFSMELFIKSLHVSFTFQRKKTAMDIFPTLLTTFHPHFETIPFSKVLVHPENRTVLFKLLLDQIPEIKSQSLHLLMKYFSYPSEEFIQKALKQSTNLCRSPKSYENEGGAMILEFIIGGKLQNEASNEDLEFAMDLINDIAIKLKEDANKLKFDVLKASCQGPTHGWLLALDKCFLSPYCKIVTGNMYKYKSELIESFAFSTIDLIEFILTSIFSSGFHNAEVESDENQENDFSASADFCEMTKKIESLIIKHNSEVDVKNVLLTEKHEAILACCWLCLLRGSSLLSTIAISLAKTQNNEKILSEICNTHVHILSSCRHRGAIEGCFESFSIVCECLLSSPIIEYQNIITAILEKVILILNTNTKRESTVTRRSAGIPLIIEATLVAEISCKRDGLFHKTVRSMIKLSRQVCELQPQKINELFDVPQVHGLYVLRHLFRNSKFSSHMIPYCVDIFQIAINCMSSSIWVVRNAATHLLGAVSSQMLGQKHIDGTNIQSLQNSLSAFEFFSQFPNLYDFIVGELELSLIPINEKLTIPKPGLHPILCILSKLTYSKHAVKNYSNLLTALKKLLGSFVYSIRHLAAESIMGLENETVLQNQIIDFLKTLPMSLEGVNLDFNLIHGQLILAYHNTKISHLNADLSLYMELMKRPWLWCITDTPFIATTCLEILRCFVDQLRNDSQFLSLSKQQILLNLNCCCENVAQKPGLDLYLDALIPLIFDLSEDDRDVATTFSKYLFSDNVSVQKSTLKWLNFQHSDHLRKELFGLITEFILQIRNDFLQSNTSVLKACMDCWITMNLPCTNFASNKKICQLLHTILTSPLAALSLKCTALKMLSSLSVALLNTKNTVENMTITEREFTGEIIIHWAEYIEDHASHVRASEPLRLSAAQSLEIAGPTIFRHILLENTQDLKDGENKVVQILINVSLSLLHDEQPDIREPLCHFISEVCNNGRYELYILHQNILSKAFLKFILENFASNFEVLDTLIKHCFGIGQHDVLNSDKVLLFDKEPFNLYEEPVEIAEVAMKCLLNWTLSTPQENMTKFINCFMVHLPGVLQDFQSTRVNVTKRLCNILYIKTLVTIQQRCGVQQLIGPMTDLEEILHKISQRDTNQHKRLTDEIKSVLLLIKSHSN